MTAPGQEPDEVITAIPGKTRDDDGDHPDPAGHAEDATADVNAIGDNHMPDDLRRAERGEPEPDEPGGM